MDIAKLTTARMESLPVPTATAWLLGECMQARGQQEMWVRQRPEVLKVLCEQASIQSVDSCNRIEGGTVLPHGATCVFDLLCIHPFRDGNGRVSRLLTTFLLEQEGFAVCRYVSLDSLVETRKEEYYSVLAQCSVGWHEGRNDIAAWWNLFLSVLREGYRDFAQKVDSASGRPAKSDLLRQAILDQVGPFTLAEILALVPTASPQFVKKVLLGLKQEGILRLTGRGRGALCEIPPKGS